MVDEDSVCSHEKNLLGRGRCEASIDLDRSLVSVAASDGLIELNQRGACDLKKAQ